MSDCVQGTKNETNIENLISRADKIDILLDKVRNRLPVYWTFIFGCLTGLLGWLIK